MKNEGALQNSERLATQTTAVLMAMFPFRIVNIYILITYLLILQVFLAEHPDCVAQGQPLQGFVLGCLEVCWLAAIQDPPLAFDWTFP